MRIARFGILGALVLGAVGCQTDDGGPTTPNIPPLAFVRYINAVPDTNNITVRFMGQVDFVPLTISNVPYRGVNLGSYQGTEAGTHRFRAFRYDPNLSNPSSAGGASTVVLADTTFTFVAGNYYTILHAGYARAGQIPAQRMYILDDGLPAVNTGVSVRVVNAALGLGAGISSLDGFTTATATTALAGAPAFANVAYAAASTYSQLPVAAVAVQMAATGTTTSLGGALAPTGVAGSLTADPIAGATVAGSVMTAVFFGPSVGGSPAAAAAAPSVVWFADRQPPRTTP
jgi:hypothetical protein